MIEQNTLLSGSEELGLKLDSKALNDFSLYKKLLLEWNKKFNLTAVTDDVEIDIKHFLDSLTVISLLPDKQFLKVIDVGTGAGFPGIPIKIIKPDAELVLLDSLNKRLKFLDEVISQLKLENIKTVHLRAEDAGKDVLYRAKYDVSISRAVANLKVLSEYCLPLVKVNGLFIAMKGPNANNEISEAKAMIKELGGEIVSVKKMTLPFSDMERNIVLVNKIRQTSTKYPRTSAELAKIHKKNK